MKSKPDLKLQNTFEECIFIIAGVTISQEGELNEFFVVHLLNYQFMNVVKSSPFECLFKQE